ncbi:protein-cysteine N-palmitoyltransferase Rasp isoform X2 [Rhodnius prolixus]|uniref:protein-cysteine N-palmitoyltransferase Rasp isoform X2 n=1 Tax=Rhodnius prolixus TaxID=13249 RepID=UPI003D18AC0F
MCLPKFEIFLYFIIWIICFLRSFYNVYVTGDELLCEGVLEKQDLATGWSLLARSKDVSDSDWVLWTAFLLKLIPWIFVHLIFCELVRYWHVKAITVCHVAITMFVLHFYFPMATSLLLILQFLLFYFVTKTKSRFMVWLLGICILTLINSIPTAFKVYAKYQGWNKYRIRNLLLDIFKYCLWYHIYEIASHYFYCHSMHFNPQLLVPRGLWTLSGVGLCMAQFFFIKYVVIYGSSIAVARAEGYPVPSHPKCVNRIYRYSDMWRNFDRGFYLFIFRCIYQPICGASNPRLRKKFFASFISFCFVFIWHGVNLTVFLWCVLNYLGLTMEALWNASKKTHLYTLIKVQMGSSNMRRLHALIASPLWIMAIVSNFIFFGGHNLGIIYVQEILKGSWLAVVTLLAIAYCMSQISIETDRLQENRCQASSYKRKSF